jgi:SnoaL-like domain
MHNSISGTEAADRLAIRELIEAYAHCADRRDAKGQMSLFTPDTHFIVYMDTKSSQASIDLHRRENLLLRRSELALSRFGVTERPTRRTARHSFSSSDRLNRALNLVEFDPES